MVLYEIYLQSDFCHSYEFWRYNCACVVSSGVFDSESVYIMIIYIEFQLLFLSKF